MPQLSKLLASREEWKRKAIQRAEENRESRKTRKRHQKRMSELKAEVTALEAASMDKKT